MAKHLTATSLVWKWSLLSQEWIYRNSLWIKRSRVLYISTCQLVRLVLAIAKSLKINRCRRINIWTVLLFWSTQIDISFAGFIIRLVRSMTWLLVLDPSCQTATESATILKVTVCDILSRHSTATHKLIQWGWAKLFKKALMKLESFYRRHICN